MSKFIEDRTDYFVVRISDDYEEVLSIERDGSVLNQNELSRGTAFSTFEEAKKVAEVQQRMAKVIDNESTFEVLERKQSVVKKEAL